MNTFGSFLSSKRKENNLTQKELANKLYVTESAVSKWENGLNMPDTSLMKQISKDFSISIDELLDGEYKESKKKKTFLIIFLSVFIFIALCIFAMIIFKPFQEKNDFQFKTLSYAHN